MIVGGAIVGPSGTTVPRVAGLFNVGETLRVAGGPTGAGVSYQWYRDDGTPSAISGATSRTYTLTEDDFNHSIYCVVTYTTGETEILYGYPIDLFAISEVGALYDISITSSVFTDDGVTPVTADGDLVYRVNDLSGNGHHLIQATSSKRPLYKIDGNGKPYLLFDGVDDNLLESGTFTIGPVPVSVAACLRRDTDAVVNQIFGAATSDSNRIGIVNSTSGRVAASIRVAAGTPTNVVPGINAFNGAGPSVMEIYADGAGQQNVWTNVSGDLTPVASPLSGATTMASMKAGINCAGTNTAIAVDSEFYGGIIVTRTLSSDDRTAIRDWLKRLGGIV